MIIKLKEWNGKITKGLEQVFGKYKLIPQLVDNTIELD